MYSHATFGEEIFHFMIHFNNSFFSQHEFMREFPLPPSHVKVLFYLLHHGTCSISDAANRLHISKPNMTPILDKLISEELVERQSHPTDRRTILVALTPNGYKLFEEHKKFIVSRIEEKIEVLEDTDRETLKNCIDQLLPIFHKLAPPKVCQHTFTETTES